MTLRFAQSARSSVGVEWEIMLADRASGELVGRGPEIIDALAASTADERFTVTGELLTNTIEITSGVGATAAEALADIADAVDVVRAQAEPLGVALLSAGSHPFAQWYDQSVTDKTRYHSLIERTQWWGRNMMIWGVHVHVGVEDVAKVMPIVGALTTFLPHIQALSASSPFWAGERTGYASNRALVFQQLPTAGLPWPLTTWEQFEGYVDDMTRAQIVADETEVRWDIRPAPRWGTVEIRVCDGLSTAAELAAITALIQTLVESFSRELDAGRTLAPLPAWYVRENKWRAARYGLDADVIVGADGAQRPVREHLAETLERLSPVADDLGCASEFAGAAGILATGTSGERQSAIADASGGDLRAVVTHLIAEFEAGRALPPRA
ncbi:glutamate--cysteine ligase [Microbacterium oryzae]|uniref:glutamate--cysteine ligase n=1 Tax=Microbacterium oryzae TaxID=743009 RepID=UPI0031E39AB9